MTYYRLLPSAGGAIIVTAAIGLAMAFMIRTEFAPQESLAAGVFEINPVAEDIKPELLRKAPQELAEVKIPPPPPSIDKRKSDKPAIDIKTITGAPHDWTPPDIALDIPIITVGRGDAQPYIRNPPIMPSRAQRSGHCLMDFSVGADGAPFDISASYCTQNLFERASIQAVSKWKYRAKTVNGRSVTRQGLSSKISFRLNDDKGALIPE